MSRRRLTRHKCRFCDEHLRTQRLRPAGAVALLVLCQLLYCRHCFQRYARPIPFGLLLSRSWRRQVRYPLHRFAMRFRRQPAGPGPRTVAAPEPAADMQLQPSP